MKLGTCLVPILVRSGRKTGRAPPSPLTQLIDLILVVTEDGDGP